MRVAIYYHHDLDGLISASMVGKTFTDNNYTKMSFSFHPINYDIKNWVEEDLKKKAIFNNKEPDSIVVVDYLYHPQASLWYDHHELKEGVILPEKINGRFCPSDPSCAHTIFMDNNREEYKDEDLVRKIVEETNMIDSAQYPNIEYVYEPNTWGGKFRLAMMEQCNDEFVNELIRTFIYDKTAFYRLADGNLPWSVEWRYRKTQSRLREGWEDFKKVAKFQDTVVSYTEPPYVKSDRFFSYRLFPDAKYACYIKDWTYRNGGCQVSVAVNPFISKYPHPNIKEICAKFGGGGHADVGGIPIQSLEQAQQIQKEVVIMLQEWEKTPHTNTESA